MRRSSLAPLAAAAVAALAAVAPATVVAQGATQQPAARPAPASPRDTARGTVGGAQVMVDYSRPYKKGRTIFAANGLAPYGKVWRTGANAATTLVTSADLMIGTTRVPKGTYTLYTVPGEKGWTLAINKQTGQWGTSYDQAQDLARVPMTVRTVGSPVEQFTIAVTGSALTMSWDTTQASVPLAAAK